jgi:hypothetical protein
MDAIEKQLIATSKIPANSGHSLHKGTPREAFIKQFLQSHLPETVSIGTGEIIDNQSLPGQQRNQFDIVIYKKNYPKLDFGGGISGFLIESVIATIEVKSTLTSTELESAFKAAKNSKSLIKSVTQSFSTGYIPPAILNFVVAYDGPQNMSTVSGWIPQIHDSLNISCPSLSTDPQKRMSTPSPSIDGIFILERGFLYFDNVPIGFVNDTVRQQHPDKKWVFCNTKTGNLLLFFIFLQEATANIQGQWLNPGPYLKSFHLQDVQFV